MTTNQLFFSLAGIFIAIAGLFVGVIIKYFKPVAKQVNLLVQLMEVGLATLEGRTKNK